MPAGQHAGLQAFVQAVAEQQKRQRLAAIQNSKATFKVMNNCLACWQAAARHQQRLNQAQAQLQHVR
jgi:hypothetical protein